MDVNALRVAVTVLSFLSFVGIWIWAWKGSNRSRFEELSRVCVELDGGEDVSSSAAGTAGQRVSERGMNHG